jgi:hypothetical protein
LLKLGFPVRRVAPNKSGLYPVLYGSYSSLVSKAKDMKNSSKPITVKLGCGLKICRI